MEQYIPKSALLAEIERLKDDAHNGVSYHQSRQSVGLKNELSTWEHLENAFATILKIIDTLEVKDLPIWEKVSPDTGQTTLYKDGGKSYLERFGYRIDLKDLDKLPKKNLKAQKGE